MTVTRALTGDEGERMRSLASVRRARERERLRLHHGDQEQAPDCGRQMLIGAEQIEA